MYENIDKMQYTPMMRQYLTIKEQYKDVLVFFRLGDFYEMFFNDAIIASKELEIVLTKRDAGASEKVPMCGVPFHSVNTYLDRLTDKGYKVAIVEQLEDANATKGIVERGVVKVITPGTIIDSSNLDEKNYNYITTINKDDNDFILGYCDLSTGENFLTRIPNEDILVMELVKLKTKEIVIGSNFNLNFLSIYKKNYNITCSIEDNISSISYMDNLLESLDKKEKITFNRLFNYIVNTQKRVLVHMQKVNKYNINGFLKMDYATRKNLELTETLRSGIKKNTLLGILDKCVTAMGSRFLKKSINFPLIDLKELNNRYDIISKMQSKFIETIDLRESLQKVYDLERILGKISYENCNPKDLVQLGISLNSFPSVITLLKTIKIESYFSLESYLSIINEVYTILDRAISDDAPFVVRDGGVIKEGYNEELDQLRSIKNNGENYILELESAERERTGIKNLRISYNRIFGYYIEIPNSSIPLVKDEFGYIRKQTISTGERYINQELKEKESLILRASEKIIELEVKLFVELRNNIKKYILPLQEIAKKIALIDMLQAFCKVSKENNYVRPILTENEFELDIKSGRHPVIELTLDNYISNDLKMTPDEKILLITGPNMSGKSTYMRQIALISIMAQMGCFVSAKSAKLSVFDAIYTRIGASDDLVGGESTFMIEMKEVNNALTNATNKSLIIFDEIGRGTATYDGIALAQAIIEYLHQFDLGKILFSTHYHELTNLEESLGSLKNVHVSCEEVHGEIVFMHKVLNGSVNKSYGINVAKLANIPLQVILRSQDLLLKLEKDNFVSKGKLSLENYQVPLVYDSKTEKETLILKKLKEIDIYSMNPMEALNFLDELQKMLKK